MGVCKYYLLKSIIAKVPGTKGSQNGGGGSNNFYCLLPLIRISQVAIVAWTFPWYKNGKKAKVPESVSFHLDNVVRYVNVCDHNKGALMFMLGYYVKFSTTLRNWSQLRLLLLTHIHKLSFQVKNFICIVIFLHLWKKILLLFDILHSLTHSLWLIDWLIEMWSSHRKQTMRERLSTQKVWSTALFFRLYHTH